MRGGPGPAGLTGLPGPVVSKKKRFDWTFACGNLLFTKLFANTYSKYKISIPVF